MEAYIKTWQEKLNGSVCSTGLTNEKLEDIEFDSRMRRKNVTLRRYRGNNVNLQFSYPDSTKFYVDAFLLIVNCPYAKRSLYQILDVDSENSTCDLPFNPSLSTTSFDIGEVTIYGLKRFVDTVNGGWYFGIRTFGSIDAGPDSTNKDIILKLATTTKNDFPKFREEKTFEIDNVFYPPSTYSLANLSSRTQARESVIILLEEVIRKGDPEYKKFVFIHHWGDIYHIPFRLEAATDYRVRVKRGTVTRNGGFLISASAHVSFQSYMTQVELEELFHKAVNHIVQKGIKVVPLTHFYRTKPSAYFDIINRNHGGVMKKYIKNLGGDQASSLNRNIKGLFFSAHLDRKTLAPPLHSPYGDQRIHIPVSLMMRRDTNLYFADFYCHYYVHRVTLVITHQYSESDIFCKQRLLQLDIRYNPFLTLPPFGNYAQVTAGLKVEVFYTENVNIASLLWFFPSSVYFTRVEMGQQNDLKKAVIITTIGFNKKEGCTICNLNKRLRPLA